MGEHPYYRFFRPISLEMDRKLWRRMPRHSLFKHEYLNGKLWWTPRPNTCDVYLDLEQWESPQPDLARPVTKSEPVAVRQLRETDWERLPRVYCAAFCHLPPLSQWDGAARVRASRCILEWARQGKDGPLLPTACFVARAGEQDASNGEAAIVGAAIITLLPAGRLRYASRTSGYVPHLNWIFVPWMEQRRGVATMLLGSIVRELRALGHSMLASTVITGNAPAVLWHWSCGFRLQRVG